MQLALVVIRAKFLARSAANFAQRITYVEQAIMSSDTIGRIQSELKRLGASKTQVALDSHFEPEAGELVHVKLQGAEWRLLPEEFEQVLKELPAGAGDEGVRKVIEAKANTVWHGPAPKDSRDTSHQPT